MCNISVFICLSIITWHESNGNRDILKNKRNIWEILYCTVLHCTILYCTVQYSTAVLLITLLSSYYITLLFSLVHEIPQSWYEIARNSILYGMMDIVSWISSFLCILHFCYVMLCSIPYLFVFCFMQSSDKNYISILVILFFRRDSRDIFFFDGEEARDLGHIQCHPLFRASSPSKKNMFLESLLKNKITRILM